MCARAAVRGCKEEGLYCTSRSACISAADVSRWWRGCWGAGAGGGAGRGQSPSQAEGALAPCGASHQAGSRRGAAAGLWAVPAAGCWLPEAACLFDPRTTWSGAGHCTLPPQKSAIAAPRPVDLPHHCAAAHNHHAPMTWHQPPQDLYTGNLQRVQGQASEWRTTMCMPGRVCVCARVKRGCNRNSWGRQRTQAKAIDALGGPGPGWLGAGRWLEGREWRVALLARACACVAAGA